MAELYITSDKNNYQVRLVTDIKQLTRKQKRYLPQPLWLIKQISAELGQMSFGTDDGFSEIAINFPTKLLKQHS
ncbi:hypothetical protein [Thalassotalea euphylliae]|uniref:Uncharacterized protein n=1 Tax=Thalassotalea euphylliae TaxID=1655234 RepID=A0A3E0U6D0_9GAMM|nr:hypothetical protein [Thalassotalea euphylliae]REL32518.1 hypothetical protein DXX94_18380 [Thalassotalea euphylliae]